LLCLGFSSGLPFGVLADPLSAWLTEAGVGKTGIGLFALVSLPYSLKFLCAPFIDRLSLPVLTSRFGRRRGWILLTQGILVLGLIAMGAQNPAQNLTWFAVVAVIIAIASASQDVVLDAYRVEILNEREVAAGAASMVLGWRIGQLGASVAGLLVAEVLPWPMVFALMAIAIVVGVAAILASAEPPPACSPDERCPTGERSQGPDGSPPRPLQVWLTWMEQAFIRPFAEFLSRRAWLYILLFIMFYKFGDAVLSVMRLPFLLEIGFTKTEIAEVAKIFGTIATILGGFIGGILVMRLGLVVSILGFGVLMALSNLGFAVLLWTASDMAVLSMVIALDNISTGMGTVAFVAYLSSLCNVAYTATQYALLTSFMAASRTILASSAGWLVDQTDWLTFFVLTTIFAFPGLLLFAWMTVRYPRPKIEGASEA
jgi:PAT family beta-lactamase induction signal transducer AmpG